MQCIAKINYLKLNKSNLYAVPNSNREVNKHFNVKLVEKKLFPRKQIFVAMTTTLKVKVKVVISLFRFFFSCCLLH